jgi:YidC/Oxa1 family membrane protein insertase
MDTQRIIALIVFSFSALLLWEAWQKHNRPPLPTTAATSQGSAVPASDPKAEIKGSVPTSTLPTVATPNASVPTSTAGTAKAPTSAAPASTGRVNVRTDTLDVDIDLTGGDIRRVTLLSHFARGDTSRPFTLMQDKVGHYFIAQTGLLGEGLPNHTSQWQASNSKYELGSEKSIDVVFTHADTRGVTVKKIFTFTRGSYVVNVRHEVKTDAGTPANAKAYFQFLRDANPPEGESSGNNPFTGIATFTGPAVYTDTKKFQKVAFGDIDKAAARNGTADHAQQASDGWLAMVQHYFVSAWLPAGGPREFFTKKQQDNLYSAGVIVPVAAGADGVGSVSMPLYLGPQEQDKLAKLAPGLDLVVDYGWLSFLAFPMFVVLSFINGIVGNWGWTIVIFTILLKLVFFPLNQKAGKSMAHMKTLMPKMEALKARYGDDKMKLNQAMMELYKTEKVNPLGGCLPILIQIPFFIALYWVLLGAVELRNAPWVGWITDLSTPDPFYVLPVIMGVTMFVQTKLNPQPTDPIQAKVMTILPIVFSFMFLFFPAGLVLYWTMQNLLGIAQQWYINKTFGTGPQKAGAKK